MVAIRYAAPATSRAGDRPNPATRTPPTIPPNGMPAQLSDVFSELTRPTRCGGMRSKITAPMIGLMNPDAKPPTAAVTSTAR